MSMKLSVKTEKMYFNTDENPSIFNSIPQMYTEVAFIGSLSSFVKLIPIAFWKTETLKGPYI